MRSLQWLGALASGVGKAADADLRRRVRVDTDTDTTGVDADADADSDSHADTDSDTDTDSADSGAQRPWSKTISIGGDPSDFSLDETFVASSGTAFITWDAPTSSAAGPTPMSSRAPRAPGSCARATALKAGTAGSRSAPSCPTSRRR